MSLIGKTPKLTSLPEMAWWSIQRDVSIYTALSLTDYMNLQSGLERSQPQPRFSPLHTIQNIDADPWKAGGKGRGLAQLARVYHHPWLRHIEIVRQQNQNHAKQTGSTSWQGGVYATVSWSIQGLFREVLFFPSQSLNLPSSQPRLPVIGANFRARFTDTVLGNQACSAQTKSKEIAWVIGASSCRATVSSKQGCGEWQWSVTREQCDRSHFMRLPSKRKKKQSKKKRLKKTPSFVGPPEPNCWRDRADQHQPPANWITAFIKYSKRSSSAQRHWRRKYRSSSCPFCRASLTLRPALQRKINRGFVNKPRMAWG